MKKKAVIISCFDWYEKRLKFIKEVLQNDYEVRIITSDFNHATKKKIEKNSNCIYLKVPKYKKNLSLARIKSHLKFGKECNEYIRSFKPDLIYLLVPPNNTAEYCLKYVKKHNNTKYILDIIDMWPESMPIETKWKFLFEKKWISMRNRSIRKADCVITECELYINNLYQYDRNIKTETLHLYKDEQEEEQKLINKLINRRKLEMNENSIVLGYLGSINYIIDIEAILNTVKALKKQYKLIEFRIIGDGEQRKYLINELEKIGIKILFYGKIFDEKEKINIMSACNYAFNVMKSSVLVGLTIKSIDYFSYGIPIINNIPGDTWKLIEQYNAGINISMDWNNNEKKLNAIDCNKRALQAVNARTMYLKEFTPEAFKNKAKKIFDKI